MKEKQNAKYEELQFANKQNITKGQRGEVSLLLVKVVEGTGGVGAGDSIFASFMSQATLAIGFFTWLERRLRCWCKSSPVGAAVCENKRVGRPGVAGAHMQRIVSLRADLPGRVQVVNLIILVGGCCGMGIVGGEAFVDVAVVDNGLWRRRVLREQRHVGLVAIEVDAGRAQRGAG